MSKTLKQAIIKASKGVLNMKKRNKVTNIEETSMSWDDIHWNAERLSKLMNETDAVTVAYGIKTLMS